MAAQHFRQIAEACETLSDPDRRRHYDAVGPTIEVTSTTTFGFEGFDFTVSASGAAASTFGDLFADTLTAPFQMGAAQRGADIHQTLVLTLEQACVRHMEQASLTRHERCGVCAGFSQVRATERPCGTCEGTGAIRSARGHMIFTKPCTSCRGTGALSSMPCGACQGRQTMLRVEPLTVQVPAGIHHDDQVRVPGKGHAGRNGGAAGDFIVSIEIAPHAVFHREGDDLRMTLPIAIHEAALGARIDVPAVDGQPARVKVPPGTQSGQRFRVRERGMPSLRDGRRGDLLVECPHRAAGDS